MTTLATILALIRRRLRTSAGLEHEAAESHLQEAQHKCESECCPSRPVTTLDIGSAGVVSCLTDPDHPRAARLASLGILPGVPVRLVQAYPAWVLRVGFAEIALDSDLARLVRVITGGPTQIQKG